jgi:diguanylate cyclase (GGDEF)-like protein
MRLGYDKRLPLTLGAILVAGFLTVNLYSLSVSSGAVRDMLVQNTLPLTSNNIYSDIQASLLRPIYVSSLMAHDTFLIDWMAQGEQDTDKVIRYLQAIQERYDVFSAFVVSALTLKYYHYDGVLKTLAPGSTKDQWFFSMASHPAAYRVDIDTNEAASNRLTIFINHKILDTEGRFIGVTGVGLDVANMSQLIADYKERYDRDIYFVDRRGVIQSHADERLIGTTDIHGREGIRAVADEILGGDQGSLIYADDHGTVFLRYRFIPELDWYLIVEQAERAAVASLRAAFYRNLAVGAVVTLVVLVISTYTVRRFQARLQRMATIDSLSGLYNRQTFEALFATVSANAKRYQRPLALLLFDIDRFKHINDQHGHLAGDRVIEQVAQIANTNRRASDLLARWGGDEFVMLLTDCPVDEARRLGDDLRSEVSRSITVPGCNRQVTLSVGITPYHDDDTLEELLSRADEQLYRAKAEGRDRVVAAPGTAPSRRPNAG